MDKNALRDFLAKKVEEKVSSGYEVPLYAADVGEPDRLKKSLASQAPSASKKEPDPYSSYIESVKEGTYTPAHSDEPLQEGYRRIDRKREAKSAITVRSRSTGTDTVLGAKPKAAAKEEARPQSRNNVRLDDLSLFF